eukprot:jgi/Mesvir1/19693/Mv25177-RA.1
MAERTRRFGWQTSSTQTTPPSSRTLGTCRHGLTAWLSRPVQWGLRSARRQRPWRLGSPTHRHPSISSTALESCIGTASSCWAACSPAARLMWIIASPSPGTLYASTGPCGASPWARSRNRTCSRSSSFLFSRMGPRRGPSPPTWPASWTARSPTCCVPFSE